MNWTLEIIECCLSEDCMDMIIQYGQQLEYLNLERTKNNAVLNSAVLSQVTKLKNLKCLILYGCQNFDSDDLISLGGFPIEKETQINKLITYS